MSESFMGKLHEAWVRNNSMVCVGLDPDLNRLPAHLRSEQYPIFAFNKAIIDATADLVCAYKPQVAYYAGAGAEDELQMTIDHIHEKHPGIPVIFDAKRGDIGPTAERYAQEAFDRFKADAVTLNPYMGTDTIKPFISREDKGSVILCRTSNPSGDELQNVCDANGIPVYQIVAGLARDKWNANRNIMLVIGATYPSELAEVRAICPEIPFLVPGVGAQGGDVQKTVTNGKSADGLGLVINSSRGIIYASFGIDFAEAARNATRTLRDEINLYR